MPVSVSVSVPAVTPLVPPTEPISRLLAPLLRVTEPEPALAASVPMALEAVRLKVPAPVSSRSVAVMPALSVTVPLVAISSRATVAPLKDAPPEPVLSASVLPLPLTVPPSVIGLLAVVSVVSAPSVTASLYVCAPVVRIELPLIVVVPPESVVKLAREAVAPTVLPKLVLPPVYTVNVLVPLTVSAKVTALMPALRMVSLPSVTAPLNIVPRLRVSVPLMTTGIVPEPKTLPAATLYVPVLRVSAPPLVDTDNEPAVTPLSMILVGAFPDVSVSDTAPPPAFKL